MTDYQAAKAVAAACIGIAARVVTSASNSSDRLRDFDHGEIAAAGLIEKKIRELDLLKLIEGDEVRDPIEDIAALDLDQRRAVCRWVEDRMVNAIQPLSIRLQRESPVNMGCDGALHEAQVAVDHVMEHVNEIRRVAGVRVDPRWEPERLRDCANARLRDCGLREWEGEREP